MDFIASHFIERVTKGAADWEPIEWTIDEREIDFTFWGQQAGASDEEETNINAGPIINKVEEKI